MTEIDPYNDIFDPELGDGEREELAKVADLLESGSPLPRPTFRGELGRRLVARRGGRSFAPARLRVLVAAYAGSGLTLLAVAAIGLAGAGPFAA